MFFEFFFFKKFSTLFVKKSSVPTKTREYFLSIKENASIKFSTFL